MGFDATIPYDDPARGAEALRNRPVAWLAEVQAPYGERSPWSDRGRFPSTAVRDYFLSPERDLDDETKRAILRELVPQGQGVVGSDARHFDRLQEENFRRIASGEASEYERRLVSARLGGYRAAPLPDLTWVIDLVDWQPRAAMDVLRAYLIAHGWVANDQVIDGLDDALAFVRRYYVETVADAGHRILDKLSDRELEFLSGALWRARGFDVHVTPRTRDGGFDVMARRTAAGETTTTLLVECRSGSRKQTVTALRALFGAVSDEGASGGVMVGLAGFTAGPGSATELAARNPQIELIDGAAFAEMLAETWGSSWIDDVEGYIARGQRLATRG